MVPSLLSWFSQCRDSGITLNYQWMYSFWNNFFNWFFDSILVFSLTYIVVSIVWTNLEPNWTYYPPLQVLPSMISLSQTSFPENEGDLFWQGEFCVSWSKTGSVAVPGFSVSSLLLRLSFSTTSLEAWSYRYYQSS